MSTICIGVLENAFSFFNHGKNRKKDWNFVNRQWQCFDSFDSIQNWLIRIIFNRFCARPCMLVQICQDSKSTCNKKRSPRTNAFVSSVSITSYLSLCTWMQFAIQQTKEVSLSKIIATILEIERTRILYTCSIWGSKIPDIPRYKRFVDWQQPPCPITTAKGY